MNRMLVGKIVGGGLLGLAVASVFLVEWRPTIEEPPPPIRPLKTLVVGTVFEGVKWQYPGRVSASVEAEMAFEVAGNVRELLVKQGNRVERGQIVARLDPSDYENAARSAEAELRRALAQLDRVKEAAASNAVSEQEVSNAQATYDKAEAENNIRQKALADTELKAQFGGVVARTYVQAFENVQAKQPILNLQNITAVEVDASIPESRIAQLIPGEQNQADPNILLTASFDHFPGRTFALEMKEFSTEADPVTQTYNATFIMKAPEDVTILPGMTVLVSETRRERVAPVEGHGFLVPLDIVPVDGLGQFFVWVLEEDEGDVFVVTRREVTVGEMSEENISVLTGLSKGDRIAAAGVHILQEGQKVRLLHAGS